MENQQGMFVQNALREWNTNTKRMSDSFDKLSDEQMMEEIAPGKNRPVYLLGHMAAVHDMMLPLMGLGERKLQHLDETFLKSADKTVSELPAIDKLRSAWKEANETLTPKLAALSADEWLQKHTSVSDEDFAREPHRNRLSILQSRTSHIAYHLGQLALARK